MARLRVDFSFATDAGKRRETNEDTVRVAKLCRPARGVLAAVADGMGGLAAGEVASRLAVDALFACAARRAIGSPAALDRAFDKAHESIRHESLRTAAMGSTLVASWIANDGAFIANVGDSRAYLLRRGCLRQVTTDHNLAAEGVSTGLFMRDEAGARRAASVLTRSLGGEEPPLVDTYYLDLRDGDSILLCSDGLSSVLTDVEIGAIAAGCDGHEVVEALVEAANGRGSPDNVSVVLLRCHEAGDEA